MILSLRDQLNLRLEWGFFLNGVAPSLHTAVAVHRWKNIWSESSKISVFQDRIQLPHLHLSRFYFFFALTFLQTQFMPSFEGNG